MKTRNDFVSNSSSSSFVLWGASFDLDQLADKLIDAGLAQSKADINIDAWCYKQFGACDRYAIGYNDIVIGLPPDAMKDDETLMQFKLRIFGMLAAAGAPAGSLDDIKLYKGIDSDGDIQFD